MSSTRRSILIAGSMVAVAAATAATRHALGDAKAAPPPELARIVPRQFAGWRELPSAPSVVSAQTQEMLQSIYNEMLARAYAAADGYQVMLSIAYGGDQRGVLRAHKPEVCYPAQGFQLHSNTEGEVATPYGRIAARRLNTSLGARKEPVTYWFTVGDKAIRNKFDQRIVEVRLGLTGQIPDGLLFRVSSIDGTPAHAYAEQDKFVAELLKALPAQDRLRLSGLAPEAAGRAAAAAPMRGDVSRKRPAG